MNDNPPHQDANPALSVVIPSYNPTEEDLTRLYQSLLRQDFQNFEVIIVDDASRHGCYDLIQDTRFRVVGLSRNSGPAAARNRGAREARAGYLFFTDTDCELSPSTLTRAYEVLRQESIVVGDTRTRVETWFGRAVALLGFPGGGALGFHQVWRVDGAGYTNSFSSCNLALRNEVFDVLGRFNESFPVAGGEDTVLARRAVLAGERIRYVPEMLVYHVEKKSLRDFLRWQITRGRGNYYIKKNVPGVKGYLRLRLWTFRNSLREAGLLAPLVILLILLSVVYQSMGYYMESRAHQG